MKTDHHHHQHHHHHHHHNPHVQRPNGADEPQMVDSSTSPSAYNTPQIKSVLKKFKMSALKSLQGPSSAIYAMDCKTAALMYHESAAAAKAAAAAVVAATAYANYGVVAAAAAATTNSSSGGGGGGIIGMPPAAMTGAACSPGPGILLPEPIKPVVGLAPVPPTGLTTSAAAAVPTTTTVLPSKKQQQTVTSTTPTPALSASSASSSPQPLKYSKDVLRLRPLIDDADDDPPDAMIKEREKKHHLEFPIPILSAPDKHCSAHGETLLDGDYISCFVVGGERRLCLPQLLNTVLQDFSIAQINALCDELRINCSRCTSEQLQELKDSGVLPAGASSCGLITQTDAERLVGALTLAQESPTPLFALRSGEPNSLDFHHPHHHHPGHLGTSDVLNRIRHLKKELSERHNVDGIKLILVHHRCFGRGYGLFDIELFLSEDSKCVQCIECKYQMQPKHFVRHRHGKPENFTCHWGFDSTSWRNYLMAWDEDDPKVEEAFDQVKKKRFDIKRKFEVDPFQPIKKPKLLSTPSQKDESASPTPLGPAPYGPPNGAYPPIYYNSPLAAQTDPESYVRMGWALLEMATRESSAFRPWNPMMASKQRPCSPCVPPYLSRGPPVLQNPERVVPVSEWERFEPHYQPNVALAPVVSTTTSLPQPPPPPQPQQQHHHLLISSQQQQQQQSTNHNRTTATTLPTTLTTAKTEPAASAAAVAASVVRSSSNGSCSTEQQRRDEETIKLEKQDVAVVKAMDVVDDDDDDDCGSEIEVTAVDLRDSGTAAAATTTAIAANVVVVDAEHKIKPHLSDAETPTQLKRESAKESTPEPDRGDATSPAKATSTTTDCDAAAMPTTVITIKDEAAPPATAASSPLKLLSTSRSHSRSALVTPPTSPPSQICKEEPQEPVAYNNALPSTEHPCSLAQMVASFEERFVMLKPKPEVRDAVRDFLDQLLLRDKELPKRIIKRETDSPVMLNNTHHNVDGET
ncbi:hypothetical protein TKK_0011168 [Trichogramma kaykai]|uniref:c-SKI SMAD4-binding domain-containing protein n=1 Tax=Trichogramma kaykai TaxID=54128 RepID=A0ABD2WV39_9HYME